MSRRISVTVRGLPVDVVYTERGPSYDFAWYFADINWRMIDDRVGDLCRLSDREIRNIEVAIAIDLCKRRCDWHRRLAARREAAHAS